MSVVLVLVLSVAPPAGGLGLDSLARSTLVSALASQGMTVENLGFHKQWAVDSFFRLRMVDRLLDGPLDVIDSTRAAAAQASRAAVAPVALLGYQWSRTDVGWRQSDSVMVWREIEKAVRPSPGGERLPPAVGHALELALASFAVGRRHLNRAVSRLSESELDRLVGEAPDFWRDLDDTTSESASGVLHREFGLDYDTTLAIRAETLLAYARKVDRAELALSGMAVALGACEARALLRSGGQVYPIEDGVESAPGVDGGVLYWCDTEWGRVVVGAMTDNVYREDCAIVIDLGGDDRYVGRQAGGVGIIGQPFGVVIDLGGDDRYDSRRPFSQGAALFGAGVLIDCAGDDVYRSSNCAQGAAIFGTGLLWDSAGCDIYDAGFLAQGAGHYGVALLVDGAGNDSYRASSYCQGFAGTWGYGLLAEQGGHDIYYAGGTTLHEPLLPHEHRSFAQGFAIGVRPDASGGIGFLCDRSGNDFYNAEVYAQGVSYWYSLGMLWDGGGFDKYSAAQYSQGAGIHLSIGSLVDEGGDDMYISRLGPSQGTGHDFSVGLLLDRAGNDGYYCSGGQGVGLTNSVGLFMDEDGNDWYACTESVICHGSANAARGFGGAGVFLDLAGRDKYSIGNTASDAARWNKGTHGAGVDLPRPATVIDEEPDVDTLDVEDDSGTLTVDTLFKIASTWEVGNAQKRVKRARKQLNRLGSVALDYVFKEKADTKDGLESRAIEFVCREWPDTAKPLLYRGLHDHRYLARQNAAYWLGQLRENARDAVDSLYAALRAGRITPRRAAQAFGDIGDSGVVSRILYLLQDDSEPSRIVAAEACGKLKSEAAIPALVRNLGDRQFTVRTAAEMALVSIGQPVVRPLIDATAGLDAPALGHALRALGSIVGAADSIEGRDLRIEARRVLRGALRYPNAFVRAQAVDGLSRIIDEPLRLELAAARAEETDEFVLGRYRVALRMTH